jgi:hypothetical protein
MGTVFKNQTKLRLILNAGVDITDASDVKIAYVKPDGTIGDWAASILNNTQATKDMTIANEIDQDGQWRFWLEVTYPDGTWLAGEASRLIVKIAGN